MSVLILSVFVYATYIEPNAIEINKIDLRTDKFDGELTIAHISDIQTSSIDGYEKKVFKILSELNADMIIHTGDLVQPYDHDDYEIVLNNLADLFAELEPKHGIFNVVGNVDNWKMIPLFDVRSGVRTLVNESVTINDGSIEARILGLSWPQSRNGDKGTIARWVNNNKDHFKIIMGHQPDYVMDITSLDIDLCLAGHTHGGQVRIPFVGPVFNASNTPKSWARGFRRINNVTLNVSPGIGTEHVGWLPSIRFNCPPSITVIRIVGS